MWAVVAGGPDTPLGGPRAGAAEEGQGGAGGGVVMLGGARVERSPVGDGYVALLQTAAAGER